MRYEARAARWRTVVCLLRSHGYRDEDRRTRPSHQRLDVVSNMVDIESIIKEATSDLNQRIAERVRELRAARGLSLDALASKSSVSRSMISLIERGESSPTAVVLEKLAAGLGVMLAALFDAMQWPVFHSWGLGHGSFLIAIPLMAWPVYWVLGRAFRHGTRAQAT